VDVGSIGRTTYKLLSCDCVRVASQDPEEELVASNLLTNSRPCGFFKKIKKKGKNTKLVHMVYLIYNLLPVVSKRTQKSLWYVKKNNLVPTVKFHPLT
jgi:hypothetical protein